VLRAGLSTALANEIVRLSQARAEYVQNRSAPPARIWACQSSAIVMARRKA